MRRSRLLGLGRWVAGVLAASMIVGGMSALAAPASSGTISTDAGKKFYNNNSPSHNTGHSSYGPHTDAVYDSNVTLASNASNTKFAGRSYIVDYEVTNGVAGSTKIYQNGTGSFTVTNKIGAAYTDTTNQRAEVTQNSAISGTSVTGITGVTDSTFKNSYGTTAIHNGAGSTTAVNILDFQGNLSFVGWKILSKVYADGAALASPNFTATDGASVDAVAQWSTLKWTLSYPLKRNGYSFSGWVSDTNVTAKDTVTNNSSTVNPATTAYRVRYIDSWTAKSDIQVTFDFVGNTKTGSNQDEPVTTTVKLNGSAVTTQTFNVTFDSNYTYNGNAKFPVPTLDGYTFQGWYLETPVYTSGANMNTEDTTIVGSTINASTGGVTVNNNTTKIADASGTVLKPVRIYKNHTVVARFTPNDQIVGLDYTRDFARISPNGVSTRLYKNSGTGITQLGGSSIAANTNFDAGGRFDGFTTTFDHKYNVKNSSMQLPKPTRNGYIFVDWKLMDTSGLNSGTARRSSAAASTDGSRPIYPTDYVRSYGKYNTSGKAWYNGQNYGSTAGYDHSLVAEWIPIKTDIITPTNPGPVPPPSGGKDPDPTAPPGPNPPNPPVLPPTPEYPDDFGNGYYAVLDFNIPGTTGYKSTKVIGTDGQWHDVRYTGTVPSVDTMLSGSNVQLFTAGTVPSGKIDTADKKLAAIKIEFDHVYGKLPTPTLEGYDFVGWELVTNCYTPGSSGAPSWYGDNYEGGLPVFGTAYAKGGGASGNSGTGTMITYYDKSSVSGGTSMNDGATRDGTQSYVRLYKSHTLRAVWRVHTYDVSFDRNTADSGTGLASGSMTNEVGNINTGSLANYKNSVNTWQLSGNQSMPTAGRSIKTYVAYDQISDKKLKQNAFIKRYSVKFNAGNGEFVYDTNYQDLINRTLDPNNCGITDTTSDTASGNVLHRVDNWVFQSWVLNDQVNSIAGTQTGRAFNSSKIVPSSAGTASQMSALYANTGEAEKVINSTIYQATSGYRWDVRKGYADSTFDATEIHKNHYHYTIGDKNSIKNLTKVSNSTVQLYARWKDSLVRLPAVQKDGAKLLGWFTEPQKTKDDPFGVGVGNGDVTVSGGTSGGTYANYYVGQAGDLVSINKDIQLYAWFNETPIFVDVYEGLFFEGQEVSYKDLLSLVSAFDFEDDYNKKALKAIYDLPEINENDILLPIIVDRNAVHGSSTVQPSASPSPGNAGTNGVVKPTMAKVDYYYIGSDGQKHVIASYECEEGEETRDIVDIVEPDITVKKGSGSDRYVVDPNWEEDTSLTAVDGVSIIHGVYRHKPSGTKYYTTEAKMKLEEKINASQLIVKISSIQYEVTGGTIVPEANRQTQYTRMQNKYWEKKYKAGAPELEADRDGYTTLANQYLTTRFLDTSTARISKVRSGVTDYNRMKWNGKFWITYEVTDSGILLNGKVIEKDISSDETWDDSINSGTITGSDTAIDSIITMSYTRECEIRYNQFPQIYKRDLTWLQNAEGTRDDIIASQFALDSEDLVNNPPWWYYDEESAVAGGVKPFVKDGYSYKNLQKSLRETRLDTIVINPQLMADKEDYKLQKYVNFWAIGKSTNDLLNLKGKNTYTIVPPGPTGTNVTDGEIYDAITSFNVMFNVTDQWGKNSDGSLSSYWYGPDGKPRTSLTDPDPRDYPPGVAVPKPRPVPNPDGLDGNPDTTGDNPVTGNPDGPDGIPKQPLTPSDPGSGPKVKDPDKNRIIVEGDVEPERHGPDDYVPGKPPCTCDPGCGCDPDDPECKCPLDPNHPDNPNCNCDPDCPCKQPDPGPVDDCTYPDCGCDPDCPCHSGGGHGTCPDDEPCKTGPSIQDDASRTVTVYKVNINMDDSMDFANTKEYVRFIDSDWAVSGTVKDSLSSGSYWGDVKYGRNELNSVFNKIQGIIQGTVTNHVKHSGSYSNRNGQEIKINIKDYTSD